MSSGIPFDKLRKLEKKYTKINNIEMNDEQKERFAKLKGKIVEAMEDESINANEKGEMFEALVRLVFCSTKIFRVCQNKPTTSNEIDFLIQLNWNGRDLRASGIIPKWIPDKFLIECKNYKKPVKVDYLGKFYSLMDVSKIRLGLFISNCHISGRDKRNWEDAAAFVNKINLKYSESSEPVLLLDISLDKLALVVNDGYNIIDLIMDREAEIMSDINSNISENISQHENEEYFKNLF